MLSFRFCQYRAAQLRWQHGAEASLVQGLLQRAWFVQYTSVRMPSGTLQARRVGRPVSEALAISTHPLALGSGLAGSLDKRLCKSLRQALLHDLTLT